MTLPGRGGLAGRGGMVGRVRLLGLATLLLSGCTLVDQTTFAAAPEAPPPAAPAPTPPPVPVDPRRPLLTIEYATPSPDYVGPLRLAIRAAESRKRDVEYDVIAVAPSMNQAAAAQEQAVAVMREIISQRVPDTRVHLGLRAEPWLTNIEVRVYVR